MPYVKIEVIEGVTREQKAAVVADVTRSLVDRLGKRPEQVFVVIDEVSADNWGAAGILVSEREAAKREVASAANSSQ
ncbi:MAG: 4-oxalocrotonate tautomerase family protein [Alphaproteobacteria bacterium]|nr:4-oxalocrotonate tautomerase family protein [Alphaproteobacteria bacterium]MBU0793513.1 4-oxalocrotonate tautomerase family protein [Alphaproteobacteria bacterium]MBU0877489.1 4-oxalocrotonate tautomerase family protein [Alphaproteobacteria bacterium]MBU1768271.1 4-oxalocrotonate tautomerase family protein [Alphaproteobacteria bacterium]